MDLEKDKKTKEEIDRWLEEFLRNTSGPRGEILWQIVLTYARKCRPDLEKEINAWLAEGQLLIQNSVSLTEHEKKLKADEVFWKFLLILREAIEGIRLREKPMS